MNRVASNAARAVILAALPVAACTSAPQPEPVGRTSAPIISTSSPVQTPPSPGSIPPLARQHGLLAEGAFNRTGPFVAHQGVFTDGTDLPHAPAFTTTTIDPTQTLSCPGGDARCQWVGDATSDPFAEAMPAFGARLGQALGDAASFFPQLDDTTLNNILSVLSDFGFQPNPNPPSPQGVFLGYDAEFARWEHSETHAVTGVGFTYDDPSAMAEHRQRGARLYCAAREAQNHHQSTSTKSMGKQSAFSLTLFGQTIRLSHRRADGRPRRPRPVRRPASPLPGRDRLPADARARRWRAGLHGAVPLRHADHAHQPASVARGGPLPGGDGERRQRGADRGAARDRFLSAEPRVPHGDAHRRPPDRERQRRHVGQFPHRRDRPRPALARVRAEHGHRRPGGFGRGHVRRDAAEPRPRQPPARRLLRPTRDR